MLNPDTEILAGEKIRVLDRDGWCTGSLTDPESNRRCLIGAARAAARELNWPRQRAENAVRALARKVWHTASEQQLIPQEVIALEWHIRADIRRVEYWNDCQESEAPVRLVLEKVTAG